MATTKSTEIETILLVDVQTGETIERELNADEVAQRKTDLAAAAANKAAQEAKAAARQSALAKLAELGLTEEEVAAL
jgi:hypothetical protein